MSLPFDLYPWLALALSILALGLFSAHALDASSMYRRHHDDRAAIDLLVAVTLAVAAVGLTISALAAFADGLDIAGRHEMREIGLGIVRGAMVVTAGTMLVIDRQMAGVRR